MNNEPSKYRTEYGESVARRAAQLAKREHVDWMSLTPQERNQFKERVREEDKASGERS